MCIRPAVSDQATEYPVAIVERAAGKINDVVHSPKAGHSLPGIE